MRQLRLLWIWTLALLISGSLSAHALQLFVWSPFHSGAGILLAAKDGETPEAAARRYVESFLKDPALAELTVRSPFPKLEFKRFKKLNPADFKRRILILANMPQDLTAQADRVKAVVKPAKEAGASVYIVPVAADLGLNEADRAKLLGMVDQEFMSFVAIGGDDIDRRVFGEENRLSYHFNFRRDQFESALIRRKIQRILKHEPGRKDRLLGICRGAQMAAKVMGYPIGEDIPTQIGTKVAHGTGAGESSPAAHGGGELLHPIEILPTKKSLVYGLVGHKNEIVGNSYHHQYIVYPAKSHTWVPLERSGFSPADGITEWLEYDDSIILSQMHPEIMAVRGQGEAKALGRRMMKGLIEFVTPLQDRCATVLRPSDDLRASKSN